MTNLDEDIKRINQKLQLLLKKTAVLQKENEQLNKELAALQQVHDTQVSQISQLEQQVGILKSAAGQLSEPEKKELEKNITRYIKELDKCIGFLSE